jgi:hypothetical protein
MQVCPAGWFAKLAVMPKLLESGRHMRRSFAFLIALTLLVGLPAHGEPTTQPLAKTSPEAADAKARYETAISKLREEFAEKAAAEQGKYVKRLESLMLEQTRKANLEGALSIREELTAQKNRPFLPARLSGAYQVVWGPPISSTHDYVFDNGKCSSMGANGVIWYDGQRAILKWDNGYTDLFISQSYNNWFCESRSPGVSMKDPPSAIGSGSATPSK